MTSPLDIALVAVTGAVFGAIGLVVATYWYNIQEFRRRGVWADDATRLNRLRATLTTGSRFAFDSMSWKESRRILPRVAIVAGLVAAGIVLLGVGFNEVFLS